MLPLKKKKENIELGYVKIFFLHKLNNINSQPKKKKKKGLNKETY